MLLCVSFLKDMRLLFAHAYTVPRTLPKTAAYGHFGREDEGFTWEQTGKADALRAAAGLNGG